MLLPIVLDRSVGSVGLAGTGEALERRREWLRAAGVQPVEVATNGGLRGLKFLFVTGFEPRLATELAGRARSEGVLVNVEDQPALCDFHVPALVRRGDLTISVSTGGRAPALAKLLREWLDARFGAEWAHYLDKVSDARSAWRSEGAKFAELTRRTREMVREGNWLA